MLGMGWFADYPDPENFLFLLITKEAVVDSGGENRCNYTSPEYDQLFYKMKAMDNGPERQAVIDQMIDLVRKDSPWVFEFHPQSFGLAHSWVSNNKPQPIGYNGLKYERIDGAAREKKQLEWNAPHYAWPLLAIAALFLPIFGYVLLRSKS
jgi:ABC-type oligopeptide transport system substrate-binding subunit